MIFPLLLTLQLSLASADQPAYARKHHKVSDPQSQAVTADATIALVQEGHVSRQGEREAAVESEIKAPMSREEIEHMNSNFSSNFGGGI
jgi:hypothetical protein